MASGEWRISIAQLTVKPLLATHYSLFALFPRQYKHRLLAK